ncbi:hypothetical protein [Acanthamoeba polyphaga mimivirus]|nr:hypothetical protein [Acanthamoeba castellanii mamavirus]EJN41223.1 hypothetical protein lvs_R112 [Acanthamoeba polyphaga lentillevirus]QTF49058.1 hypothetical protein [Mimivirus reunion]UMZ08337.1 hypothetical protein [Acanthamoeba polyphaga mimivirus]WMV61501.1 hypothetical protein qu_163 [Mimivirus sp.]
MYSFYKPFGFVNTDINKPIDKPIMSCSTYTYNNDKLVYKQFKRLTKLNNDLKKFCDDPDFVNSTFRRNIIYNIHNKRIHLIKKLSMIEPDITYNKFIIMWTKNSFNKIKSTSRKVPKEAKSDWYLYKNFVFVQGLNRHKQTV